jgi:predicted DNA-binding WGR domain protein
MALERTLELRDGKSNRFWTIRVDGDSYAVTFGKLGSAGQTRNKQFASAALCAGAAEKIIADKLKEGYLDSAPSPDGGAKVDVPAAEAPAAAEPESSLGWLEERNPCERFRRFASGEYQRYTKLFYFGLPFWDLLRRSPPARATR